jgi:hypothetical protein
MAPPIRYLSAWISATLGLLAAVAAFNLLVDPYDLFRVVDRDGFNRIKSHAGQRAPMFKRKNVERIRPNTLILGNSRAEIGFDPDSPAWPAALRPVFNLALPGTGPQAALDEFRRAQDVGAPRLVLLGLDFLDFRVDPSSRLGLAPSPLPPDDPLQALRDRTSALLTIDALVDSLGTLKAQRDPYPASLTDAGFNPMRDYVGIARREGYHAMFRQRNQENAKSYVRGWKSIYLSDGRLAPAFAAVEQIIAAAGERRTAVRLVIYPYHAQTLVLFHQAGLWPAFEAWKRELVKLVARAPAGSDVELWDFSSFSPYADESVPGAGDTVSELRWYWEAGHFKKSLGDILLARLFDARGTDTRWGRRLTPQDIEEHLGELRLARDDYERAHSAVLAELSALTAAAIQR